MLKRLNAACEEARRRYAAWRRWKRKLPHNRVVRRCLRDERGRRVGCEVVGPLPEPPLPPLFCVRRLVPSFWGEDGRPLPEPRPVEDVVFGDLGIPEAYRAARKPAASPETVRPLRFSVEDLQHLVVELTG
jgi:hypothetical protein